VKVGDLVVHINGEWGDMPRVVIKVRETTRDLRVPKVKALIGLLSNGEIRWTHKNFLRVVSNESR
jgi:hypothetical protein